MSARGAGHVREMVCSDIKTNADDDIWRRWIAEWHTER